MGQGMQQQLLRYPSRSTPVAASTADLSLGWKRPIEIHKTDRLADAEVPGHDAWSPKGACEHPLRGP